MPKHSARAAFGPKGTGDPCPMKCERERPHLVDGPSPFYVCDECWDVELRMVHGRGALSVVYKRLRPKPKRFGKLNEDQVRAIRRAYDAEPTLVRMKELAAQYDVTVPNVRAIVERKTWKELEPFP